MILVHVIKNVLHSTLNPSTPRGRNEVQKNKWTPHYQAELYGESEKNNSFATRELLFLTKYRFLKKRLLSLNQHKII